MVKTKIVGSTFEKSQDLIKKLRPGQELVLKREPENIMDRNAIGIYLSAEKGGSKLGYVKAFIAKELSQWMDKSPNKYSVKVLEITGEAGGENYGCNIEIIEVKN